MNTTIRYTRQLEKKPVDLFFGRTVDFSPESYDRTRQSNMERIQETQKRNLEYHIRRKRDGKEYIPGQTIFVKINKRSGTKLSDRFKEEIVKENRNSTVVTESGRIVHKKHIRN